MHPLPLRCRSLRLLEQELGREFNRVRNQFVLLVVLVSYWFKPFLTSFKDKLQEDCLWRRTRDLLECTGKTGHDCWLQLVVLQK